MIQFFQAAAFCLVFSVFSFYAVQAQTDLMNMTDLSKVNIDKYSNEELISFYQSAVGKGLNNSQIFSLLEQRGLSQAELIKLQSRIQTITRSKNLNPPKDKSDLLDITEQPDISFDSSSGRIRTKKAKIDKTIFGSELFTTSSLSFEPNLRIPPPPNYVLGPDDQIVISVYGYSEQTYNLKINELGQIYIPKVGPVLISGLTIEKATDKIRSKLAGTIYTAINTGKTQVQVTLGKIRSIRVTVIGQAKQPGTYTVSSLTTLYNLLYLCGGPTDMGSYRQIAIVRGAQRFKADLYDFLVYGNQKDNILLQEGDVIQIPYYKSRVTITGSIKRNGKFEMLEGETFSNLLNYSGGFTDRAYRGSVSVTRITDTNMQIIDLAVKQFPSFQLQGSDSIAVGALQDEFSNRIYISGAVQRPGPYELTKSLTAGDLIVKAGGLLPDAFLDRALIYRYLPNRLPVIEAFNPDSVLNHNQSVFLKKNDSVVINSIFQFKDFETVSVEGDVRIPAELKWRENLTLKDALFQAGGISELGDSSAIEISRRISKVNYTDKNHLESQVIQVNLLNNEEDDIVLKPFDIVIVKRKPGYSLQRAVIVQGEVLSPGKYGLEKTGTRISDVISRTGGFKSSADSSSIKIRRFNNTNINPEERKAIFQRMLNITEDSLMNNPKLQTELFKAYDVISADLSKILDDPGSSENLILEDGDILIVSRSSNLVKVSGEVYSPTLVTFKPHKSLKYYVQQAGNFMPHAHKAGSFVIYPNGKVKSVRHLFFFRFYPSVIGRSEVFVPQKDNTGKTRMSAAEWAIIVSALSIVSNVVINLTK